MDKLDRFSWRNALTSVEMYTVNVSCGQPAPSTYGGSLSA